MTRIPGRLALLAATAAVLSACVSLLPKGKPAQLYRFQAAEAGAAQAQPASAPKVGLTLARIDMQRAAAGDQILTVTGDQVAYIDAARWVSPASALFEAAVQDAFAARSTSVRLLDRADFASSVGSLRLDVPTFETRYAAAGAAPVVRVSVRAEMTRRRGEGPVAAQAFSADVPASADRLGAIVAAYDAAVDKVTADIAQWADANLIVVLQPPNGAPPPPSPAPRQGAARTPAGIAFPRP